jgi:hypothetical protein
MMRAIPSAAAVVAIAAAAAACAVKFSDSIPPPYGDGHGDDGCPAGMTPCAGGCVDLSQDHASCGACGRSCRPVEVCVDGACSTECPAGRIACAGTCVDPLGDTENCGGCGERCAPALRAHAACLGGSCALVCEAGWGDADDEPGCECRIEGDDADCNGADENCDGEPDDGYAPVTCGLGPCARSSFCRRGVEECFPGSPEPETCDGVDNDCDGTADDAACSLRVRVTYSPRTDTEDRFHSVMVGCQSFRDMGCRTDVNPPDCIQTSCTDGQRCALPIAATATTAEHVFTALDRQPQTVCYCSSTTTASGTYWNGVIEVLQGDTWVEMGRSDSVRASNWLCVSGAMPQ